MVQVIRTADLPESVACRLYTDIRLEGLREAATEELLEQLEVELVKHKAVVKRQHKRRMGKGQVRPKASHPWKRKLKGLPDMHSARMRRTNGGRE